MVDVLIGVLEVKPFSEDFYACQHCGKSFRISSAIRQGGDFQLNLTALCDCVTIKCGKVYLVENLEAQADD